MVWNIPVACNRASADFMISSPLMAADYQRLPPDYAAHLLRPIKIREPYGEHRGPSRVRVEE